MQVSHSVVVIVEVDFSLLILQLLQGLVYFVFLCTTMTEGESDSCNV